jgi:hypothetical protein
LVGIQARQAFSSSDDQAYSVHASYWCKIQYMTQLTLTLISERLSAIFEPKFGRGNLKGHAGTTDRTTGDGHYMKQASDCEKEGTGLERRENLVDAEEVC